MRYEGHKEGTKKVRDIAIHAKEMGVKCLTLYAFSTENWKRPQGEVNYIMSLPKLFFATYLKEIMANDIKIKMIGEREGIPKGALSFFEEAIADTKDNQGMILNFAVNYGSHYEIVRGIKSYADDVLKGRKNDLEPSDFSEYLMTADLMDIDLMIRTGGEKRLSNFLLWQLAYSELIFLDTYWPDFSEAEFDSCIEEFKKRKRRFGGLNEDESN